MNRLFDIDGPAMRFVTKIAYSAYLNILWFLCCLPIVTVGASTTALFYVTIKIARNEEGNITRAFFHSFKENFQQSTVIWLIMLALGIVLGVDGYVFYHMRFDNALWTIGTAIFLVALAAYLIILMYIFPLLSHFANTTRAMFKNAIMIGMRFLVCTALMAAVYFAMALVVIRIFTPAIIFGEGLCALLCSYLLSNILALCEVPQEPQDDAETAAPDIKEERPEKVYHLKDLHGKAKLRYIWDYYKLPICVAGICLYIIGYTLYGHFTHRDTILYTALVNMNVGDDLTSELNAGFLDYADRNTSKEKLELYTGLYLTDNPGSAYYEYTNASRTKIVGSIDRECLDIVLMNREAFDAFAQSGYLLNIDTFLKENSPKLYETLRDDLVSNTVILEDNALDVQLDPSITYSAETDEYPMGIDLSDSPVIRQSRFDGTVYLGVIANTPRTEMILSYLEYLYREI